MKKQDGSPAEENVTSAPKPCARANVSFDLTVDELDTLIELCGDNGEFRLGIRLAERRQRLVSNVNRMTKEQQALEGA